MPLFRRKPNSKISRRLDPQIRKELEAELKQYAKQEDIERFFNDRVTAERRRQLWASMSPQLRTKVLDYVKKRGVSNEK